MTRMTGPDCAVMCNLINIYTRTRTHARTQISRSRKRLSAAVDSITCEVHKLLQSIINILVLVFAGGRERERCSAGGVHPPKHHPTYRLFILIGTVELVAQPKGPHAGTRRIEMQ